MQIHFLIFFVIVVVDAKSGNYEVIDLSDILNVDYMPGSLLVLENTEEKKFKNDTAVEQRGTFDDAFATMGYHRKMMNEYLCRSYVSEQIISEMKSTRIRRRLGNPANNDDKVGTRSSKIHFSIKKNLLEDEGSSNYKDWLKKSATLEDIYRHYDNAENREAPESSTDDGEDVNEEFDAHDTGYGYQQPQPAGAPSKLGHSETGKGYLYHGYPSGGTHSSGSGAGGGLYGSNSGYGTGGAFFGGHSDHAMFGGGGTGHSGHGYGGSHEHTPKHHGGHDNKDKLADLFDIALTALAYLSFGMFIIQVIMCISMANTTTAPAMTMMMPMSMSPTGVEPTGGGMTGDGMIGGGGMTGGGTGNEGNANDGGTTGGESTTEGTTGGEITGGTGGGATGGTRKETTGGDGNGNGARGSGVTNGGDGGATTGNGDGGTGEETTGGGDGRNGGDTTGGGSDRSGTNGDGNGGTETGTTGGGNDVNDNGTAGDANEGTEGATTGTGETEGTGGTGTDDMGTGGTGGTGTGRDATRFRSKRDIPVIVQPNNEALNELARRILISIEAALVAHQDDGNCLRKILCENNMYSRNLQSNQKYWVPVWSLGMSWLSGRLITNIPRATSMLDSLKASLLGLGKADCEFMYHDCDLAKERQKRRRRRRKRSTH